MKEETDKEKETADILEEATTLHEKRHLMSFLLFKKQIISIISMLHNEFP